MTMSDPAEKVGTAVRVAVGISGAVAVIVGILILAWPAATAMIVTAIIAIYAVVAGLIYAGAGISARPRGGWARLGHIVLGLVFVVAGILAFLNLGRTTAWLAVFLGILVGIMWIVEGIVSLSTLSEAPSRGWTIFFAILAILAGIVLVTTPFWGVAFLWWLLGIFFVAIGIVQAIRALTLGRRR